MFLNSKNKFSQINHILLDNAVLKKYNITRPKHAYHIFHAVILSEGTATRSHSAMPRGFAATRQNFDYAQDDGGGVAVELLQSKSAKRNIA